MFNDLDPFKLYRMLKQSGPILMMGYDTTMGLDGTPHKDAHIVLITGIKDVASEGASKFMICYQDAGGKQIAPFDVVNQLWKDTPSKSQKALSYSKKPHEDAEKIKVFDTRFYVKDPSVEAHYSLSHYPLGGQQFGLLINEGAEVVHSTGYVDKPPWLAFGADLAVEISKDKADVDILWRTLPDWIGDDHPLDVPRVQDPDPEYMPFYSSYNANVQVSPKK